MHAASFQTNQDLAAYRAPRWQPFFAFFVGFSIQFNLLVGGGDGGAGATGGYGYRITDFIAVCALGLLAIYSIAPQRYLSLGLFGLVVAAFFLSPVYSSDPRTSILAQHYALYSLGALYIVIVLNQGSAIDRFCWGLIAGVLATVPIFVLQDLGYTPALIDWGLMPGYFRITGVFTSETLRYTGLWAHPNEAGHVAALSAAAGTYFVVVRQRFLPLAIVAGSLLAVFYYTMSRGGLIAGGFGLALAFLFARQRFQVWRLVIMAVALTIMVLVLSQVDFVASRFRDDPNAANNITERVDSILFGFNLLFTHPFGVSTSELTSLIFSGTGGIGSQHNGFLFFGGVFGLLPLAVLLAAFAANLRIRNHVDVFFAVLVVQVSFSFLFEVLPGSYSYVFVMCLVCSRAFLKLRIGALLAARLERSVRRRAGPIIPRPGLSHDTRRFIQSRRVL